MPAALTRGTGEVGTWLIGPLPLGTAVGRVAGADRADAAPTPPESEAEVSASDANQAGATPELENA